MIYMKYIKQFIIGSSLPSVLLFYNFVYNMKKNIKYTYYQYTLFAPFVLGMANVASLIIAEKCDLSYEDRFRLITILLYLYTIIVIHILKLYNFNNMKERIKYYISLLILYIIVWNYIIYSIEKFME